MKLWSETQARQTLIEFAKEADVLLPGRDEAEFLTGEADPVRAGRLLLQAGPQVVVVKLGAQGALVVTEEGETEVPGFPVEQVVDPVGAGDAFAAGFLAATLEEKSPVKRRALVMRVVPLLPPFPAISKVCPRETKWTDWSRAKRA